MYLTYRGDARRPDDTTPLGIPGLPAPLVIGESIEITDDFAKGHFNCTAKQLCDRLCTRYNASYDTPRLESSKDAPKAPKSTDSPPPEPAKE